jgi:hypothetical protein
MIRKPCTAFFYSCLLILAANLGTANARADDEAASMPVWQVLEFEQQAFFVTARSRVEIVRDSENCQRWQLRANSSVASNSEDVVLSLAAKDGSVLHRSRLSSGKEQRYKSYEFLDDHILRQRRDPPANTSLPPSEWPLTSSKEIDYPPLDEGTVVTDAYVLLALAGRFQTSAAVEAEVVVNTEFNFYRVRMTHGKGMAVKANYQVEGKPEATTGTRETRAVRLQISPLGEQPDKADFSLLGLQDDITVLFDWTTGLPLQLRGQAPRVGQVEIDLKAVTLRATAA